MMYEEKFAEFYSRLKTNVRTKFYESWLTNVEIIIREKCPSHRRPCFLYKLETLSNSADIIRINVQPSFNEDWRINKTSRVLTRLYHSHLRITAMPPNGHIFQPTGNIHF
ncbi:hypothetical protein DPMN_103980 [Dreissena polymorpha]|uniref:Uncharacterized protein n=1 Tax=Dreissena polymorpha TaxID=45954 RepID=A0A9D4HC58_DREPO|nr:hypothetical protein DPMN_103980 [Dreissena polymorpha]